AFSRDGSWLAAGANEVYRIWGVGSWDRPRVVAGAFPYAIAFAPDGSMMAVCQSSQIVRLINPGTGQTWAALEASTPQTISWLCFTPDAGQLAVACSTHVIQVWDLRRIRQQLVAMGLDWESPPCSPRNADVT